MEFRMLDGNEAAVEAMCLAGVSVIAAYPITPQSPISEKLANYVSKGTLKAEYVRVESEHSALSIVTTAQATGVRAGTATASNGLAYMHEVLTMTSGNRLPVVMPVVNRGVAAPWTLWCEHGDSMAQRDTGWLQFYCENVQEVLDFMILAYKVSEDSRVLLPSMVCYDGFFLSHSSQKIRMPAKEKVEDFLGPYKPKNAILDTQNPVFMCDLVSSSDYTEMRYQQKVAMENAISVILEKQKDFEKTFGRKLHIVEEYQIEDAQVALIAIGSMCGTAKYVVDQLRKKGKKVGFIKLNVFRPFPADILRETCKNIPIIGVFDRSPGLGSAGGPVWNEICSSLMSEKIQVHSFIGGLGGRDVTTETITRIYEKLLNNEKTHKGRQTWIDLKMNPLEIRTLEYENEN